MFALCFRRTLNVKFLCHDKAPSLSLAISPKVRRETLLYEGRLKVEFCYMFKTSQNGKEMTCIGGVPKAPDTFLWGAY